MCWGGWELLCRLRCRYPSPGYFSFKVLEGNDLGPDLEPDLEPDGQLVRKVGTLNFRGQSWECGGRLGRTYF